MTDIETAAQVIVGLQAKREQVVQRVSEIGQARQACGYDAHAVGSREAKARLAKLNAEFAELDGTIQSLDGALNEARDRLAKAEQVAARAAAVENAKQMREVLKAMASAAADLDASLTDFVDSADELRAAVNQLHALGSATPSHQMVESWGMRATLAALGRSIFHRGFEVLPPRERRSFTPIVGEWVSSVEDNFIKPLLGSEQTNKAA